MSDLQCPARILLAQPSLDSVVLAGLVADERIARRIDSATALDLDEVADLHRGETVLVVAGEGPHVERNRPFMVLGIDADGWREATCPAPTSEIVV